MTSVNFTVFVKANLQTRRFTLSHCSAFGGGKPSAVASAKKGGREFKSKSIVQSQKTCFNFSGDSSTTSFSAHVNRMRGVL